MTSATIETANPFAHLIEAQRAYLQEREEKSQAVIVSDLALPTMGLKNRTLGHTVMHRDGSTEYLPHESEEKLDEEQRRLIGRVDGVLRKRLRNGYYAHGMVIIGCDEDAATASHKAVRFALAESIASDVIDDIHGGKKRKSSKTEHSRKEEALTMDKLHEKLVKALMIELIDPKRGVLRYAQRSIDPLTYRITLRSQGCKKGTDGRPGNRIERAVTARKLRNGQLK